MKFSKPKGNTVGKTVAQTGGIVSGMVLSNGVAGAIPMDDKTIVKAIVLGAGLAVAVTVQGTDGLANFSRAAGVGMAAQQTKELVKEFVAPSLPDNKFLNDSFEKGAISTTTTVALNARRRRSTKRKRSLGSIDSPQLRTLHTQPIVETNGFVHG